MLIPLLIWFHLLRFADAEVIRIEKSLHPAETTISGTLTPFAFAINGEPIPTESKSIREIKLNGKKIPVQDEATGSFYIRTEDDEIRLTGSTAEALEIPIFSAKLPRIRSVEIDNGTARFDIEGSHRRFTLDGKNHTPENIPAEAGWIDRPHVVELLDESGSSRLYNLNFTEWKSLELRSWSIGFAPIGPPGPMIDGGFGIYGWRSWENQWVVGTSLNYGEKDSSFSRTKAYGINLRIGKYPFLPGQGIIDFRRLIVGPFLGRSESREKRQFYAISDGFWITGFFLRETLIRYRSFGLSLQGDFGFLTNRPGNVRAGIELSYTW